MSDCAWCEPDGGPCHSCVVWDGECPHDWEPLVEGDRAYGEVCTHCRVKHEWRRTPTPDRAVGGYAYLMCEDAVPTDKEKTA